MRRLSGHRHRIAETRELSEIHQPPAPPPPGRDVWPWLALLGAAAAIGLVVWLVVLNRSPARRALVPDVVGLPRQQAIGRVTAAGFDVRAVLGPAGAPRGVVATQSPTGGSRHDRGSLVRLGISNGRRVDTVTTKARTTTTTGTAPPAAETQVPDVTGLDMSSGAGSVESTGFVAETDPVTASGPAGSIVRQDPAAGSSAQAASVVRLAVAVGSSRPAKHIPGVTSAKAAAARASLLDAELTVRTEYRHSQPRELGTVLSQTPGAGATVPAYTQVTIVVAR